MYQNPTPTTDLLMEHNDGSKEGIVLIVRDKPPYEGKLAFPGGFAEMNLTFSENARKEGREETGLEFVPYKNPVFTVHSQPDRDPRGHNTSVVLKGRGYGMLQHDSDARDAQVYTNQELYELFGSDAFAFDHEDILKQHLAQKGAYTPSKRFKNIGVIGRFRPLHAGAATLLEELCEQSEQVYIGIGSSNMPRSVRNPWDSQEVAGMIDGHLQTTYSNYRIVSLDDFGHIPEYSDGQKWSSEVQTKMNGIQTLVSGNPWVKNLLSETYAVIHPNEIIPSERQIDVRGSFVRYQMAQSDAWKSYVPQSTVTYLETHNLVSRFRDEFGHQTLQTQKKSAQSKDSVSEEMRRIQENS